MRAGAGEDDALFDLDADPHELYDVADRHPEQLRRLRAGALGRCTELWSRALREQPSLDPAGADAAALEQRIQELRALGYLEPLQP